MNTLSGPSSLQKTSWSKQERQAKAMITSSDILKANILIVDDQHANISLLEDMLRNAGYVSVSSTEDPREVCELHRQHRYSLILLDLLMPAWMASK